MEIPLDVVPGGQKILQYISLYFLQVDHRLWQDTEFFLNCFFYPTDIWKSAHAGSDNIHSFTAASSEFILPVSLPLKQKGL